MGRSFSLFIAPYQFYWKLLKQSLDLDHIACMPVSKFIK